MSDEQIALARRAVACKGWRWMPGMATYTPVPYTSPHLGRILSGENDIFHLWRDETIPRLRDPATLGCLLALVREAMGDQHICICWDFVNEIWVCEGAFEYNGNKYLGLIKQAQSYAEALVLTLEDAPCGP